MVFLPICAQLVATYGSVVLRYRSLSEGNLYAALMLRDIGHSIAFHVDGTGVIPNYETGSREGVWWLPNDSASDCLILANYGDSPMPLVVTLFDAAGRQFQRKVALGPWEASRLSVRALVDQGGLAGTYGGISVYAAAHAGSLDTLHFLFDQKADFSALLKMFDRDPSVTMAERDYAHTSVWTLRAPLLALSNPDPAMAFPEGTVLQPQLFVRNTTSKVLSASLRFNWKGDTATGKVQGLTLQLRPYETRRVDVAALQDGTILPKDAHWTSVTITTNSQPDEIMAVAASYDASLRRGAQTAFSDQLTFAGEGGMWEYDALHNSLIAVGNGSTKPTTVGFTLFYNQGTQRYDLQELLQPDEQMWLDVGKLIREQVPDKNGKVLPFDLTSGSYEFRDLDEKHSIALFEGKVIYEKMYGHVVYGCNQCCYYQPGVTLLYNPLGIPLLGGNQNGVIGTDCNGTQQDVSWAFDGGWSTANAAIATVNSTGYHSGIGGGSTTTNVVGQLPERRGLTCPLEPVTSHGGDNVQVPTSLKVLSVSVLATGTSGDYGCKPGYDYGISVDIKYQVLDQETPTPQPINNPAMVPHEHVVWSDGTVSDTDIGPTRISTTSRTTAPDGTFHDAPVQMCSALPSATSSNTQAITIILNGKSYPVRTQKMSFSATTLPGHGTVKNDLGDISKTR